MLLFRKDLTMLEGNLVCESPLFHECKEFLHPLVSYGSQLFHQCNLLSESFSNQTLCQDLSYITVTGALDVSRRKYH